MCEALGAGRQSIILRKGGIAEGREGFSFKHSQFFLFPTWFHEQPEMVREQWEGLLSSPENADLSAIVSTKAEHPTPNAERRIQKGAAMPQIEGVIEIRLAALVTVSRTITSWDVAEALEPLHILQPEVIRERFNYDEAPGLHVAFVRAYRVNPVWRFPNQKMYGGCRSWVDLPELPNDLLLETVLTEKEHSKRLEEFVAIVGEEVTASRLRP